MISVVIPTYKRPDLLANLLQSINIQTLKPHEVIVVDDCSRMESAYSEVVNRYKDQFENFHFISLEKNSGAPTARNTGIKLASGDWIALVDDDDEWLPEKLAKQQAVIESSTVNNLGFVYTWTTAKGQKGQESYESCISVRGCAKKALLSTNYIMSASVLIKKEALERTGGFQVDFPSCQDWDAWIRIALQGYGFDVVEEVLTVYHRHGGESIGLSPRAKLGYKMLLEAHWKAILKYTQPINWLKKTVLYIKVWGATRNA